MTGITKSQLLRVSIGGLETVRQTFEKSRKNYDEAENAFNRKVANPIRSEHAWKYAGVANAKMVAETNASALAAARVVAEGAWLALDGFITSMTKAQAYVKSALNDAAAYHIIVDEDGTARATRTVDGVVPHGSGLQQGQLQPGDVKKAELIERQVKGYLAFAGIADRSCSMMLGRLSRAVPRTTDTADPGVLADNRIALNNALSARNLALLTRNFWRQAEPRKIPEGKDASGEIVLDVINIAGNTAGVISALGSSATGVGAVLGVTQGVAAGGGVIKGFQDLAKHAKGSPDDSDQYKPKPPLSWDLNKSEGGQGYSPDPRTEEPGEPPEYDERGVEIPYKEYVHIGPRKESDEVLIVDERTGQKYYSEDDGKSFVKIS